jgi:3D (Asp-Asp-Asp) domain-containing protein
MLARLARHAAILAVVFGASVLPCTAGECAPAVITAYAAQDYPGRTTSGIYTWPNVGSIVAGGEAYELGQTVEIEGLGSYTVADRGHLGWTQIDLLVSTHAEAVQFGRQVRMVCG